jgi:uncharacterized membrane protein
MAEPTRRSLAERMNSEPTEARLAMTRNMYFGAAGVCLLVLTLLVEVGGGTLALRLSLLASAVGIPVFVLLGKIHEYYIILGERSYAHLRLVRTQALIGFLVMIGGFALLVAVAGLLHASYPPATKVFIVAIVVAGLIQAWFHLRLERWFAQQDDQPPTP